MGTGDFTHPAWREELKEKLVPAEEGLYTLKEGIPGTRSAHRRFGYSPICGNRRNQFHI